MLFIITNATFSLLFDIKSSFILPKMLYYGHFFPYFYIDEGMYPYMLFVKTMLKCIYIGAQFHKNYM